MNTSPLNFAPLNTAPATSISTVADYDMLEFDGYSLQNASIIAQSIVADTLPTRELVTFLTPRDHGGHLTGDYFRERKVSVKGFLKANTGSELEILMNTFKRRLTKREGNLDWKLNDTVKRVTATLTNPEQIFSRREHYHITYCPFDLEFLALEPFWHDVEYSYDTQESVTSLVLNGNLENLGTFESSSVLIILIEAASGVTALNFTNTTNDDEIEITRNFVAGDVIIIDGETKSVTVNSNEVDYDGVFPRLDYGGNTYTVTMTGTSVQYTSTLKYKKNYL